MKEENKNNYSDSDIQVLEGLEAVRKRPGMYIGNTNEAGLHHLVWEIVDNAVDEALAGYCDDIEVEIGKGNIITVKDDGRGMPTGMNEKTGKSTIETIFTVLHAGGKFGGGGYKVSGGLHGVGASVVNAMSDWLEVRVYREGKVYFERFENGGQPVEPLKIIDECSPDRTGTTVTFHADPTLFETTVYNWDILYKRLQEMAFLNKGIRITLIDHREDEKKEIFHYNGGIIEYVKMLNKNKQPLFDDVVYVEGRENDVLIEWSYSEDGESYTDWKIVNTGTYTFRYCKFKITFRSQNNVQTVLTNFTVSVDVPDKDLDLELEITDSEGLKIEYNFINTPSIVATVNDDSNAYVVITEKTNTYAFIKAYTNSGELTTCKLSLRAKGY